MSTTSSATTFGIPGFGGDVFVPGDAGYDDARAVFNAMIDRRPAVIARVREHGRRRGGGERTPASRARRSRSTAAATASPAPSVVDGGVVHRHAGDEGHRRRRRGAHRTRRGRRSTGASSTPRPRRTASRSPAGACPTPASPGSRSGSGSGWLERKLGFTCDNLIEAEVVTADGRVGAGVGRREPRPVLGSPRGRRQLRHRHRVHAPAAPGRPMVFGGMLAWPAPMAGEVVRFWRDFMTSAPDEVGSALAFITAPPADFVPRTGAWPPGRSGASCATRATWPRARRCMQPLREFGPPPLDLAR